MIDDFKPSAGGSKSSPVEQNEQPPVRAADEADLTINEADIDQQLANQSKPEPDQDNNQDESAGRPGRLKRLKNKLNLQWPPTKKQWLIYGLILLVIIGLVLLVISLDSKKVGDTAFKIPTVAKSDQVPSKLSGLPVAPSVNKIPVTGVMIENSDEARPQSGLSQAGVVFEALAEGGITRFLALYQDTAPSNVGPIRSVRPYYLQWALGFDASMAHVGGSPDALTDVTTWNVKDLNEFYNGNSYHRISTREAPHNVYTSIADLNQLEQKKGFTTANFTGFPRKKDAPAKTPTAGNITMNISGPDYSVNYVYVPSSDNYNRSEGGAAMIDANTNKQISPKVVVAIVLPLTQGALDSSGAYYSDYNVLGSGSAYIFQDGSVTQGTWTKTSNTSQISFTDSNGKAIKFNPGQTWITALSSSSELQYTP